MASRASSSEARRRSRVARRRPGGPASSATRSRARSWLAAGPSSTRSVASAAASPRAFVRLASSEVLDRDGALAGRQGRREPFKRDRRRVAARGRRVGEGPAPDVGRSVGLGREAPEGPAEDAPRGGQRARRVLQGGDGAGARAEGPRLEARLQLELRGEARLPRPGRGGQREVRVHRRGAIAEAPPHVREEPLDDGIARVPLGDRVEVPRGRCEVAGLRGADRGERAGLARVGPSGVREHVVEGGAVGEGEREQQASEGPCARRPPHAGEGVVRGFGVAVPASPARGSSQRARGRPPLRRAALRPGGGSRPRSPARRPGAGEEAGQPGHRLHGEAVGGGASEAAASPSGSSRRTPRT